MDFQIGQTFEGEYPPEAAEWCNNNGAYIEELDSITKTVTVASPYPDEEGNFESHEEEQTVRVFEIKEVPAPTEEDLARSEYASLRNNLTSTDYIVIKIAEGSATEEEYAEQLAKRKAWRARVQELEALYPNIATKS